MRAMVVATGVIAVIVGGDVNLAQGQTMTTSGCTQLSHVKNVFPTAKAAGFSEHLHIQVEPAAAARVPRQVWCVLGDL